MMERTDLVSVVNLDFDYAHKQVLRDVNFEVKRGTICGLLGPNASGKSTLLKCINGVLKPRGGHVSICGTEVGSLSRSKIAGLMAVVPQQMTVVFAFTALEMVVMGKAARLERFRLPSRKDYLEARRCLDDLGIGPLWRRRFNELSGGERQLVLLARAMFQDTTILLLDEPTSHLDFKNQFMIMDKVHDITRAKNLTTVISLHDPNLAARYCTHMVMLKEGHLHFEGSRCEAIHPDVLGGMYGMNVMIESTGRSDVVVLPG